MAATVSVAAIVVSLVVGMVDVIGALVVVDGCVGVVVCIVSVETVCTVVSVVVICALLASSAVELGAVELVASTVVVFELGAEDGLTVVVGSRISTSLKVSAFGFGVVSSLIGVVAILSRAAGLSVVIATVGASLLLAVLVAGATVVVLALVVLLTGGRVGNRSFSRSNP